MHKYLESIKESSLAVLAQPDGNSLPSIDVIAIANHPKYVDNILTSINSQSVRINKLIVYSIGYGSADKQYFQNNIVNFKSVDFLEGDGLDYNSLCLMLNLTKSDYVAFLDDRDKYLNNYLKSQLIYLMNRDQKDVVYKTAVVGKDISNGKVGFIYPNPVSAIKQASYTTAVMKINALQSMLPSLSESTNFLRDIFSLNKKLNNFILSDSFNYLHLFYGTDRLQQGARVRSGTLFNDVNELDISL